MTTLREDVVAELDNMKVCEDWPSRAISIIAALLEATGAPAYCRVATDLRGEWVEPERACE